MTENRWDEIWERETSREVYDVETAELKPFITVDREWLHEVKTWGDAINHQLETVKEWGDKWLPAFRQFSPITELERILKDEDHE